MLYSCNSTRRVRAFAGWVQRASVPAIATSILFAAGIASTPGAPVSAAAAAVPAPPPEGIRIRVIGTASFQSQWTALIQDQNTMADAFYHEGDVIYGHRITEIAIRGIYLERGGRRYFVPYEPGAAPPGSAPDATVSGPEPSYLGAGPAMNGARSGSANLYLDIPGGSRGAAALGAVIGAAGLRPNFYSDGPVGAGTQWDLWTPNRKSPITPGKINPQGAEDLIAGATSAARRAADLLGTGRFLFPLTNFKRVSSPFGYRKHPISGHPSKLHKGIDLSANTGTRIMAADSGTVVFSGWKGGYGYCVKIDHHNGYSTLYGHCSKLIADAGDNVRRGDHIANVGSTGASTGSHLHFEVQKNDTAIDPAPFFDRAL